jgi:hypothetical protein
VNSVHFSCGSAESKGAVEFRVIRKCLTRFDNFHDYFRESFVPKWFGRTRQRELKMKRDGDCPLRELFSSLAGWISITYKKDFNELPLIWDTENVVWIAPWALDEFQECNFVGLDINLRALRPSVYCVPMGDMFGSLLQGANCNSRTFDPSAMISDSTLRLALIIL